MFVFPLTNYMVPTNLFGAVGEVEESGPDALVCKLPECESPEDPLQDKVLVEF